MASAHGPSTEGAGTRVCGYAIKNSGLTVVDDRQHPRAWAASRVSIQWHQGGCYPLTSGSESAAQVASMRCGVRPLFHMLPSLSSA